MYSGMSNETDYILMKLTSILFGFIFNVHIFVDIHVKGVALLH